MKSIVSRPFEVLALLLAIMASGSVINTIQPAIVSLTAALLVIMVAMLLIKKKIAKPITRRAVVVVAMLTLIFLLKMLLTYLTYDEVNLTPFAMRLYATSLSALLIIIYFSDDKKRFIDALLYCLIIIMIHAIFSMMAWPFVANSLQDFPAEHVNLRTYYYLVFYPGLTWDGSINQAEVLGFKFTRLQGIFWEPGILQLYMNLLLFISLFVNKNSVIASLAILVVFATWSTTGYILMSFIIGYWVYERRNNLKYVALSFLALPAVLYLAYFNLMDKVFGEKAGSTYARTLDAFAAMEIIKSHPIIGLPLDYSYMKSALSDFSLMISMEGYSDVKEAAVTNSIAAYSAFFGIPITLLILFLLYHQSMFIKHKLIIFIIMLTSLLTEPLGFFTFALMLIYSGYVKINAANYDSHRTNKT
jgi:hypothetical protein